MPSSYYDQAVREAATHHRNSKTYSGSFLRPHKDYLAALISRLGVTSVLDYGCGKGVQYAWVDPADRKTLEQAWGVDVAKYDPCWPPFADEALLSRTYDLLICSCVLGCVPREDLPWVIGRLHALADKAVFIHEKIGEPKKRVFSRQELLPWGFNSINWLDAIAPHRRPGIETHLSVRYRNRHGAFTGRFVL